MSLNATPSPEKVGSTSTPALSLDAASLLSSEDLELTGCDEDAMSKISDSSWIDQDLSLNFTPRTPFNLWKKLSSCEEFVGAKRSKHTIVAWNDRIYVFGGDNGRRMLNDFLVSHIRDSSWARVVYTGEFTHS